MIRTEGFSAMVTVSTLVLLARARARSCCVAGGARGQELRGGVKSSLCVSFAGSCAKNDVLGSNLRLSFRIRKGLREVRL